MLRLAHLRLAYVAVCCVVWIALIVALPRLILLCAAGVFRVRVWLSPTADHAIAFGAARWTSRRVMFAIGGIPPIALLIAWTLSRLTDRAAAP